MIMKRSSLALIQHCRWRRHRTLCCVVIHCAHALASLKAEWPVGATTLCRGTRLSSRHTFPLIFNTERSSGVLHVLNVV